MIRGVAHTLDLMVPEAISKKLEPINEVSATIPWQVQTVYYITDKCRQEQVGNVKMCCDVNHKDKLRSCGSFKYILITRIAPVVHPVKPCRVYQGQSAWEVITISGASSL